MFRQSRAIETREYNKKKKQYYKTMIKIVKKKEECRYNVWKENRRSKKCKKYEALRG